MSERFAFASPAEALDALLARISPVGVEQVELADSAGRVLAEPVVTDRPSPAVDVSAMDGYAVRCADAATHERLAVSARALIGREPPALRPGTAVHIVTGAPLPAGAEAVIRREDVREGEDSIELLAAARAIRPGTAVRRRGENAAAGGRIADAGTEVAPAVAGALASFGYARPLVRRRVRVAIVTTGDEVVDAGAAPTPWQLRDSNGPALAAMLSRRAWVEARRFPRIPDDPGALERAFGEAMARADAMIVTGGVSMGDRDHVPAAIRSIGGEVVFHRIPQRPGKPVLGAVLADGRPILGLPGNPVSVLVTARRMAAAALERLAGITAAPVPPAVEVSDDGKRLDLWWHRLVRVSAPGRVDLTEGASSGDVPAAARSDGFVEVPPGAAGDGPWAYYAWAW